MTAPAAQPVADLHAAGHSSSASPARPEPFDAQELAEITGQDHTVAVIFGYLLGGLFLVLIAMCIGVSWWTAVVSR